jgi:hypothetical protein
VTVSIDLTLIAVLIVALVFNLGMSFRASVREYRSSLILREIHALLVIWAETWPDPAVRVRLKAALRLATGS